MPIAIDPKVDYAFKKVFGSESNRDVLVDLLNAVLQFQPGREVVEVEILNPFNEKEFADDKLSVVDVKARDATGRAFAVEMQMIGRADHRQRPCTMRPACIRSSCSKAKTTNDCGRRT
jgi:predicted transposase/invertase (TIGR01784 family)